VNFFGYLNKYRIDYCLQKFSSGEHENKTLEAQAEECGFKNRGTYIRVFKSIMGQAPSEYLSSLQKSVTLY
jgi:AraC-like DNA-binding protein